MERSTEDRLVCVRLGTTDMHITRLGLGAWAMGGENWLGAWGDQDDRDSIAVIRSAIDCGVNWIDTAPSYGAGHAEDLIGRALSGVPASQRPLVFTKCGVVWDNRDRMAPFRMVGAPDSMLRELEASLRRLRREHIDLYQMHWPAEDGVPLEEYWGVLVELRKAGKVRSIGLSNHHPLLLERAERIGHVDVVQVPLSLIRRDSVAEEISWARCHGTAAIIYSPLQSGLLSGSFDADRARRLPANDWRSRDPEFGERLERNLRLVSALRPVAARLGSTVACVAIAWTLACPGVSGAIAGARRPSQIEDWRRAAALELQDEDFSEIAAAIETCAAASGASSATRKP